MGQSVIDINNQTVITHSFFVSHAESRQRTYGELQTQMGLAATAMLPASSTACLAMGTVVIVLTVMPTYTDAGTVK